MKNKILLICLVLLVALCIASNAQVVGTPYIVPSRAGCTAPTFTFDQGTTASGNVNTNIALSVSNLLPAGSTLAWQILSVQSGSGASLSGTTGNSITISSSSATVVTVRATATSTSPSPCNAVTAFNDIVVSINSIPACTTPTFTLDQGTSTSGFINTNIGLSVSGISPSGSSIAWQILSVQSGSGASLNGTSGNSISISSASATVVTVRATATSTSPTPCNAVTATKDIVVSINSIPGCTIPTVNCGEGAATITAGNAITSTASTNLGNLSWSISPATGVSSVSGSGGNTGNITFSTAGTYTVTFTAANSSSPAGCSPASSNFCTRTITVNAPIGCTTNSITCGNSTLTTNVGISNTFTATTSGPGIVTWSCPGATPASGTGSSATVTFGATGNYTMTFTITNNATPAGCSPTATQNCNTAVTVNADGAARCNNNETQVVPIVSNRTGQVWMDRNLGAVRRATSAGDYNAYGCLYSWGRNTGYPMNYRGSCNDYTAYGVTPSPYNTSTDGWYAGTRGPCPTGYRIPSLDELQAEVQPFGGQAISTQTQIFSNLFIPTIWGSQGDLADVISGSNVNYVNGLGPSSCNSTYGVGAIWAADALTGGGNGRFLQITDAGINAYWKSGQIPNSTATWQVTVVDSRYPTLISTSPIRCIQDN